MLEDILKALPLGLVMAFLIGPVFFALLETSAIKGFRAALSLDAGVIVADILFLLAAYFMTSSILDKLKDDPSLFIFGGSILCIYGIVSFVKTKKTFLKEVDTNVLVVKKNNYFTLFIKGFLLNFINIGVLGFWLGLIVVFSPQLDNDGERITVFFSTVLITYFIVDIGKIILAKSLNRYLTPLRIYWLKRLIAIIMFICGAVLIFKGAFPSATEDIENQFHLMPETEEVRPIDPELEGMEEFKEKVQPKMDEKKSPIN
ncbi:lysine transporter LysE [Nonlabens dokdonensis]|uniref:Lysine transporter LysE n=1 Tax=Nonlabens dokdonensis TaxID=328515 RepID=A0A1Z8ALD7_9FLAO|nr:LysE family transporter [Nonlabens dokdonensis]OUS11155.1 lysine transporter LysE [Nonlabens dokdonensis]